MSAVATRIKEPADEMPEPPHSPAPSPIPAQSPEGRSDKRGHRRFGSGRRGKILRNSLMLIVPLALVTAGLYAWLIGGRYETTDNAYAKQTKVSISTDVSGRIQTVRVTENQHVSAGDVLFTLDPEPFQIAIQRAQAALGRARLDVEQLKVDHETAVSALDIARSTLKIQSELYDRRAILATKGVTSSTSRDELKLSLVQAQSAVTSAEKRVENTLAALGGTPDIATDDHPRVRAALADLRLAERDLAKTAVKAPANGIINQVDDMNVGEYVAAGSGLATLFEVGKTWVDANLKETQLEFVRVGMPVEVTFDAYPDDVFQGRVASISSGTGAEFALIPAQNATGNWVKVVQRVPVRIELLDNDRSEQLRSGMSAIVSVDTGKTKLDRL